MRRVKQDKRRGRRSRRQRLLRTLGRWTQTWRVIGKLLKAMDGALTSLHSIWKKVLWVLLAVALAVGVGEGRGARLLRAVGIIGAMTGEKIIDHLKHRALGAGWKLLDPLDTPKEADVDVDGLGGGVCTNAKQLVEGDGENLCKLGK